MRQAGESLNPPTRVPAPAASSAQSTRGRAGIDPVVVDAGRLGADAGDRLIVARAGWTAYIDGVAVTVPSQDLTGKTSEGLRDCLAEAYTLAGVRLAERPAPNHGPAGALVDILRAGQRIADTYWRKTTFDVYRIASTAWQDSGQDVPWLAVIKALQRALPAATTLTEFNDAAHDAADVVRLYEMAEVVMRLPT